MNYIFPFAFAINFFAMTGFMIVLGLFGKTELAADFGIVQGATLALFYAFSANARNLLLNTSSEVSIKELLFPRIILLFPLSAISFFLSVSMTDVSWLLAIILIVRRCTEWLCELHLSQVELMKDKVFTIKFVVLQLTTLLTAILCTLFFQNYFWIGVLVWAIMPLFMLIGFIRENFIPKSLTSHVYISMLPHFGSTAITGVSVYVFRLLIFLLVGKAIAGDLYTAFAIGSLIGSVFVNALGPSLAHARSSKGNIILPDWLKLLLVSTSVGGMIIFAAAEMNFAVLSLFNKSFFFWSATGLSLIGGPLMLIAQRFRISLLQLHGDQDVMGPDLVTNLLILSFVPFAYYLIGLNVLKILYLVNATIAFVFYWSVIQNNSLKQFLIDKKFGENIILIVISAILVFPLFFQLSGNIFNDPSLVFDTMGKLSRLPIPVSVFACFGGLVVFGKYKGSEPVLYMLFFTFVIMMGTTLISTKGLFSSQRDKFILLIQFVLPIFSAVLGQMYGFKELNTRVFQKTVLFILFLIIPVQLFSTLYGGTKVLSPYMYLFSIYQQLQYVPTIFVCLYLYSLFSLWEYHNYKKVLIILTPLMGTYAILSASVLTNIILYSGLFLFAGLSWYHASNIAPAFLVLILVCASSISFFLLTSDDIFRKNYVKSFNVQASNRVIIANKFQEFDQSHLSNRMDIWKWYLDRIFSNPKVFLVGNPNRPSREEYPSAHNYYIDLVYNFGIFSLIPFICLMLFTIRKIIHLGKGLYAHLDLIGLVFIISFVLILDNSFKVVLRQPYPGIITFFLWGLLLSRLSFKQSSITA